MRMPLSSSGPDICHIYICMVTKVALVINMLNFDG